MMSLSSALATMPQRIPTVVVVVVAVEVIVVIMMTIMMIYVDQEDTDENVKYIIV